MYKNHSKLFSTLMFFILGLPFGSGAANSFSILKASNTKIVWDEKTKVAVDLNLDGNQDVAFLGRDKKYVCVGVVIDLKAYSICLGVGEAADYILCSNDNAKLSDYSDNGKMWEIKPKDLELAGCKMAKIDDSCRGKLANMWNVSLSEFKKREQGQAKKSSGLIVADGQCDQINIKWDKRRSVFILNQN